MTGPRTPASDQPHIGDDPARGRGQQQRLRVDIIGMRTSADISGLSQMSMGSGVCGIVPERVL